MKSFNHSSSHKARPFRLPSLQGLDRLVSQRPTEMWAASIDLKNCLWSVNLPESMQDVIRIGAQGKSCAIMFDWHEAPGLAQCWVSILIQTVDRDMVIVIQYLGDILFLGPIPTLVSPSHDGRCAGESRFSHRR